MKTPISLPLTALSLGACVGLLPACVDVLGLDGLEVREVVVEASDASTDAAEDVSEDVAQEGAPSDVAAENTVEDVTSEPDPPDQEAGSHACVHSVVAGLNHTCAATVTGSTWCWGDNTLRQLGGGDMGFSETPVKVIGLPPNLQDMEAGGNRTCVETVSGGVMCWGDDFFGQSSGLQTDGTTPPVEVPQLMQDVRQIAVGANHTCVRKADSSIWCWGDNGRGQVGDPTAGTVVYSPVQALGPPAPLLVAAGDDHTCVSLGKDIKCWGANDHAQSGAPSSTAIVGVPTSVQGWDPSSFATALSLGRGFSCALTGSRIMCWGANTQAQSGMSDAGPQVATPSPRADLLVASRLYAGADFGCAESLGLFCWGRNDKGQCGDPTAGTPVQEPIAVPGIPLDLNGVALGERHACVVTDGNRLLCWGANNRGQLGLGQTSEPDEFVPPTEVPVPCEE